MNRIFQSNFFQTVGWFADYLRPSRGHKDMGPNLKVFTIKNRSDVLYIDFTMDIDSCHCSLPLLPAAHFSSELIFLF